MSTKKGIVLFTAIVLAIFFSKTVFAVWNGTFYDPGDTLNPECSPTDTDCDVRSPLTSVNISDTAYDATTWNGVTTIAPSKNAIRDQIEILVASNHNPITLGTANGLSLATQVLSLALASTSTTGALSDTDWDTFNNKAPALGADDNYVTDAQLVVIGNTSGTNTGDQVVPSNDLGAANNFLTAYNSTTGAFSKAQPTWANIDKTTSSIADITTRSHTALTDIGTNTHAQIDTFIGTTVPATYVPYTGATTNLAMGNNDVSALSFTGGSSSDMSLTPDVANDVAAVAYNFNTKNTLSGGGALHTQWAMNDVLQMSLDKSGNLTLSVATAQLILPSSNDAVTPTLAFGDGDTGFFEVSDDNLALAFAGAKYWDLTATKIASSNSTQPALLRTTPTATVPSINANNGDADTGIGSAGADIMSLIAGGIEIAQFTEATSYYSTFNGLLNAATGDETAFTLNYTTNKLTSGDDYGLKIVQTDTASPGTSYLLWAGVGATSKFSVTNAGLVTVAGNLRVAGGLISTNAAGQALTVMDSNIGTSSATMLTLTTGTWTTATGNAAISVKIAPTYNQTGTASATDLLINRTETAVGSGAQLLIDAQVGGASKFSVTNTGVVQQAGCTTAGGLDADASGNIICTPSREQFKNNIVDLNSGLSDILALRPVVYTFKPEMNMGSRTRFGFISEEVAAVASEFATYDKEGKPYGLDTNAILAETVKAIQEMNLNLDAITGATIPLPESPSESFMTAFFGKLSAWLADARNEIGDVFANAFNAKEKICVDGECLTKDDIKALLLIARPISPELIPIPEPTPEPEPTPTPEPVPEPPSAPEPEPEPILTAELAP